ncbi:hypothetical protein FG476_03000 [Xylella fastidiosa subsp. multiplex]|uniref:Uncharacterized protein n=1 Tax=Xylella fastidiosa subsp. multiplex TaxID=644357 RepID=A0A9Q4MG86_XYLFS|nr:hypothetical protein Xfasm12_0563 [Xylella fastidiosa M12]MBE0268905.1 hypothetical protein [Xylella fastidiosa subsp. multiplex]TNV90200.1 hypothetical protein C5H23_04760 [Xylella fastidiosa]MBE0276275.1 hypothetical protein [Xylella fastidiosa subsp. multiplex]MBE0277791.1 hypothetical protein [Xylella fastidiosa subsp. multiplex]
MCVSGGIEDDFYFLVLMCCVICQSVHPWLIFPASAYLGLKVILFVSVVCDSALYDFVMLDLLVDSQLPS